MLNASSLSLGSFLALAFLSMPLSQPLRAGPPAVAGAWNLPIGFECPLDPTHPAAAFEGRGLGYSLSLRATGAVIHQAFPLNVPRPEKEWRPFRQADIHTASSTLQLDLLGANPKAAATLLDRLPGTMSYFVGNDPARWRTNIARFARVRFKDVYPGIDWLCYGNQRQFEYDFCLAPGASPESIRLRFTGADRLEVDPRNGELVATTSAGELRQPPPRVYQETDGGKRNWTGAYVVLDSTTVALRVGPHDAAKPLVIDPVLVYATERGRTNELDNPWDLAVDADGNAYVAGNAVQTNQVPHVYLLKLDATGTNLVYSAIIGGTGGELPGRLAVDSSGSVYMTGTTKSRDFPLIQPLQSTLRGPSDAFVCKINPAGNGLVYSTYLGGDSSFVDGTSGEDGGFGIAVDSTGAAYVAGTSASSDLFGPGVKRTQQTASSPTPYQSSLHGPSDAFVVKLAPDGLSLVYGTYLGGSRYEAALGVSLDSQLNACVVGITKSSDFPTLNAQQAQPGGGISDAFVAKLNATGSALLFSTYLGGSGEELPSSHSALSVGAGIAVDPSDNIYVVGDTYSSDFPLKNPLQSTLRGPTDGFVAKFTAQGALVYSTFLGGSDQDGAFAVAADAGGNAYVTGGTLSTNFPTVAPLQSSLAGSGAAFVSVLNPAGSALLFSTYLGADNVSTANGIGIDSLGNAYVAGLTTSTNFPNTGLKANYLRTTFVTKIAIGLAPTPPPQQVFQSFKFNADGGFVLSVQGPANRAYTLDFSTDLKQWVPLAQSSPSGGRLDYVDTRAALFPKGFYRIR
jgi:hypothetical protein